MKLLFYQQRFVATVYTIQKSFPFPVSAVLGHYYMKAELNKAIP